MILPAVLICYCIVYFYIELIDQLKEKKRTTKQQKKFEDLIDRYDKKLETMDRNLEIY
ncbi:unnamed protein product, partial [Gadus morhua 'NCC']